MNQKKIKLLIPILSVLLAMLIGSIIIAACGFSPVSAYTVLFKGAFGSVRATLGTLDKSVPLLFCGLAAMVALKGGMFNIGLEGQLLMGAISYTLVGLKLQFLPPLVHVILCSLCAVIAGAAWAAIAAGLKIWRGANVVVTTIMLNYIAINMTTYLVSGPFMAKGDIAQSDMLDKAYMIPTILSGYKVTWGYILAILIAVILAFMYRYTSLGYEMIAAGMNPKAAEAGGIRPNRTRSISMVISGGLAGLGGGMLIACSYGRFVIGLSPGYGFDGLAISVLGQNSSVGVWLSSILFGALRTGSLYVEMFEGIPSELVSILQGIIILAISAPLLFRFLLKNRRHKV